MWQTPQSLSHCLNEYESARWTFISILISLYWDDSDGSSGTIKTHYYHYSKKTYCPLGGFKINHNDHKEKKGSQNRWQPKRKITKMNPKLGTADHLCVVHCTESACSVTFSTFLHLMSDLWITEAYSNVLWIYKTQFPALYSPCCHHETLTEVCIICFAEPQ